MGSEALGHRFTVEDPTFNGKSASAKDNGDSSHRSMSHAPGTQPVSISNGPQSSASPSIISKVMKHKPNSKYRQLIKTNLEQISRIEKTLDSIESFTQSNENERKKHLVSIRNRLNEMKIRIDNFRDSPKDEDYDDFDRLTEELQQIVDQLKTLKSNHHQLIPLDLLVAPPLHVPHKVENDPAKTLIYN